MRENNRIRRRFELSLDGKQVASIVVGALVVLGAVFVLGLSVGRQLAPRPPPPPRADNPLAALDKPPVPPPPREKEPRLSAHEVLTKGQGEAPIAEPPPPARPEPGAPATGTALNSLPPPPPEKTAPAPAEEAAPKKPGAPAKAPPRAAAAKPAARPAAKPKADAVAAAVARVSGKADAGGTGSFCVQIAATQSEAEAQRLQKRHAAEGARVAVAEVPGKGTWYRVRVGAYPTREEAEKRRAALAQKGVKGFVAAGN
ncbi:MAG: SPOR domain-containing protein [Deltaproteobacteria bacterium]|nr:SPOR domain-containing protein [Deltaproteobacteria bacterium]